MRPTKRAPIITARVMPVTTAKIIIIERILVASKYKKSSNRYYRLH